MEVLRAHLERIEAVNPKVNAIVTLADDAMDKARKAEEAIMRGESWGPLHGVPFTIKDCIDNKGVRTARGSRLFQDFRPASDATVVKRLTEAGGIFMGKTNMPEFAFWWETGNEIFGRTINPWNADRTSGGSSGGEAAAIATGMSPLGLGSDVGGSIRQPSSYCGVVGLKATHGRVPLTGHWPEVLLRFMHVGPMARSVRDVALALSVLSGPDGIDPYAVPVPAPRFIDLGAPLPKLRVGWFGEGPFAPVAKEVQSTVAKAASLLADMGCEAEPVSLAAWQDWPGLGISMNFFLGEGSVYLDPYTRGHEEELTWYIKRRLSLTMPSFDKYMEALLKTELLRQDTMRLFSEFDVLLCPTTPCTANTHEAPELVIEGQTTQGRHSLACTVPFDLTGSPAVNVPAGLSQEGLPLGVQVIGRHFDEVKQLHVATALQAALGMRGQHPPV